MTNLYNQSLPIKEQSQNLVFQGRQFHQYPMHHLIQSPQHHPLHLYPAVNPSYQQSFPYPLQYTPNPQSSQQTAQIAQHDASHLKHDIPEKTHVQLQPRRGPWLLSEDKKLMELITFYGPSNWVRISNNLSSRTPKQCRERYHQNLKPSLNHMPITVEEGELIEKLVAKFGKKWAEISRHLNGRLDNSIKNWWNAGANRRNRAISCGSDGTHYPSYPLYERRSHQEDPIVGGSLPPLIPNLADSEFFSHSHADLALAGYALPLPPVSTLPQLPSTNHPILFNTSIFGHVPSDSFTKPSSVPPDPPNLRSGSIDEISGHRHSLSFLTSQMSSYSTYPSSTFSNSSPRRVLVSSGSMPYGLPPLQFPNKRRLLDEGRDGRRHSSCTASSLLKITLAHHNLSQPNLLSMAMSSLAQNGAQSPCCYGLPLSLSNINLRQNSIGQLDLLLPLSTTSLLRRLSLVPDLLVSPIREGMGKRDASRERYGPLMLSHQAALSHNPCIADQQPTITLPRTVNRKHLVSIKSAPHSPKTAVVEMIINHRDPGKISVSSLID